MMKNFTPDAQRILALARNSSDQHKHNYIGPEHIADAMVMLDQSGHFPVWRRLQLDIGSFRQQLLESMAEGNALGIGNIPYTPEVKKLLAMSARAAERLEHDRIGPEHLLLAFFDFDSPVSALFESLGLTRDSVEGAMRAEWQFRAANRAVAQLAAREAAERAATKHGTCGGDR